MQSHLEAAVVMLKLETNQNQNSSGDLIVKFFGVVSAIFQAPQLASCGPFAQLQFSLSQVCALC